LLIGAQKLDSLCKRGGADRELLDVSLETLRLSAGRVGKACGVPRTRADREQPDMADGQLTAE